jgi:hypothetical protein
MDQQAASILGAVSRQNRISLQTVRLMEGQDLVVEDICRGLLTFAGVQLICYICYRTGLPLSTPNITKRLALPWNGRFVFFVP